MKALLLSVFVASAALAQDIGSYTAPSSGGGANGVAITPTSVTTAYVDAGTVGAGTMQATTGNVGTDNVTTLNAGSVDAGTVIVGTELRSSGLANFTGTITTGPATGVSIGVIPATSRGAICLNRASPSSANCQIYDLSGTTVVNGDTQMGFDLSGVTKAGLNALGKFFLGGSGDGISQMNTGTATIDFASISAGACGTDTTVTVTGATTTAACQLGVPNGSMNAAGSLFMCYVSATDTAKVRHCCINGTCDPASGTFRVWTINP